MQAETKVPKLEQIMKMTALVLHICSMYQWTLDLLFFHPQVLVRFFSFIRGCLFSQAGMAARSLQVFAGHHMSSQVFTGLHSPSQTQIRAVTCARSRVVYLR